MREFRSVRIIKRGLRKIRLEASIRTAAVGLPVGGSTSVVRETRVQPLAHGHAPFCSHDSCRRTRSKPNLVESEDF